MEITDAELKLLKKHCKVDHSYEDDLLKEYFEWAKQDIANAVTDDYENHEEWFSNQKSFRNAVYPLTNYYFENRIAFGERSLSYAPHMVLSVVHRLRGKFDDYLERDVHEV